MTKYACTAAILILMLTGNVVSAQDATIEPKTKLFDHKIGVQMNELVRQVFNFNNSSSQTDNPYLLIYSLNFAKSGWGIRLGAGPRFISFNDDDGVTQEDVDISAYDLRLGVEKAFRLSPRWSVGVGADCIYGNDISYSKTTVRSFDSSKTDISSRTNYLGYGAMGWLRYHITPHIQIGTETSFYYKNGDFKQKITITRSQNFGGPPTAQTKITELDNKIKEGKVNLPMVFYLIVNF